MQSRGNQNKSRLKMKKNENFTYEDISGIFAFFATFQMFFHV